MTTKTCHVSLIVEVLACVKVDSDCHENTVSTIAREAVWLLSGQRNVSLEIENIEVDNIVEVVRPQESSDAR